MCGRFTLRTSAAALTEWFGADVPPDVVPRYNVAPTQSVAAIRDESPERRRRFVRLRWGLIPSWAADPGIGARMINARAETVHEKPAFRSAFRRRRCLVLADGYFEWQKNGRRKQPYYIHFADGRPFAFAAVWERWGVPDSADAVESCAIITTAANALTQPIHDRMPVILHDDDAQAWLTPEQDLEFLRGLLVPYPASSPGDLLAEPVGVYVNNPRNDGPQCVAIERMLL